MAFRLGNLVAALLFSFSALVQYNDPDPIRWIALYAGAAFVCLATYRGWSVSRPLAIVVAVVALGWAATLAPVLRQMVFTDLFRSMKADTPVIEQSRELLGVLLVLGWMIVVAVVSFLTARARPAGRGDGLGS